MKICLGGTFDILHDGHIALLKKAFDTGKEIVIGLSSDQLVKKMGKKAESYEKRKRNLEKFLKKMGWDARIEMLEDEYGTAAIENFDAIVVSPETRKTAEKINSIRKKRGLQPLHIIIVPYVLANDGIPIATRRIKSGEIDGRARKKPLKVCVPTENMVKMEAVKEVFNSLLKNMKIDYEMLNIKMEKQPFNEEIIEGAKKRAIYGASRGDYGIGIEAGIKKEGNIFFVEQYIVVADKMGYITHGKSPAFECPSWIMEEMEKGKEMKEVVPFKDEEERRKGAIWYLSGIIDRKEITKQGIFMGMLPRIKAMRQ